MVWLTLTDELLLWVSIPTKGNLVSIHVLEHQLCAKKHFSAPRRGNKHDLEIMFLCLYSKEEKGEQTTQ